MMKTRRFLPIAAIAAVALVAAACGGGDDDGMIDATMPDEMPEPVDPGPTPEEIAATTKEAKTKLDAIGAIVAANGLGGAPVTGEGQYNLAVERDADGRRSR